MKKIIGILGTISIAGSGMAGIVGNMPAPGKIKENNNLQKLIRVKRANDNKLERIKTASFPNLLKIKICNIPQTYDKHKQFFKKGRV
ncbi:hypothetical protein [Spiroplasma endosymbiont of Nephrotoma flavescens]|uniref:hypothetical protein n=1 Tax=Spiroplasma endosymbiont of Nephrotoma flavescens TaxID=3066302 RepID=UPI00313DA6C7